MADLAPIKSMEKFIAFLPPKPKIIDIGCGSGRDAKILSSMGADVLGIDFCSNIIDIAKINAPQSQFEVMDLRQ